MTAFDVNAGEHIRRRLKSTTSRYKPEILDAMEHTGWRLKSLSTSPYTYADYDELRWARAAIIGDMSLYRKAGQYKIFTIPEEVLYVLMTPCDDDGIGPADPANFGRKSAWVTRNLKENFNFYVYTLPGYGHVISSHLWGGGAGGML